LVDGQIAPTATTCDDFRIGAAADLTDIFYGIKGTKVNNVAPGVLFYFTRVTAPSSSFTVELVQTNSNATFPFFGIHQGQVKLYNADCSVSSLGAVNVSNGQVTITISGASAGQQFIIGAKYDPGTVTGTTVNPNSPPTVHYNFATEVNNVTVAVDPDGLNLRPKP
jgi:hypothetical protein